MKREPSKSQNPLGRGSALGRDRASRPRLAPKNPLSHASAAPQTPDRGPGLGRRCNYSEAGRSTICTTTPERAPPGYTPLTAVT